MKLNCGTLLLVIVVLGFVLFRYAGKLAWTPWHVAGLAIFVPAFVLFVLARLELGRAFSVKAKASVLVTTGLYSRIRNPIYVFGGLMSVGSPGSEVRRRLSRLQTADVVLKPFVTRYNLILLYPHGIDERAPAMR